jgi:hypothetical protein
LEQISRKFSFRDFTRSQPEQQQPGDRLDTEFDQIYRALVDFHALLGVVLAPDGSILPRSVGLDAFKDGVFNPVIQNLEARGDLAFRKAEGAAISALQASSLALMERISAQKAREEAEAVASGVREVAGSFTERVSALNELHLRARRLAATFTDAEAASLSAANQAMIAEDMAYRWAEKTDGPVVLAPGDPVDDGMFSAKWWAIQAGAAVGSAGGLAGGGLSALTARVAALEGSNSALLTELARVGAIMEAIADILDPDDSQNLRRN